MRLNKEHSQEIFRDRVLSAMDSAAREIFGKAVTRNDCGATDADLPRLFKCLDEQLEVIADRFNTVLVEDDAVDDPH